MSVKRFENLEDEESLGIRPYPPLVAVNLKCLLGQNDLNHWMAVEESRRAGVAILYYASFFVISCIDYIHDFKGAFSGTQKGIIF